MKYVNQTEKRTYAEKAINGEGSMLDYGAYFEFYPHDLKKPILSSDKRRFA